MARKKNGPGLAHALGVRITTGQAAGNELDGLHEQNQKRIGKEHVFGKQRRVVREHRHKRKEQQRHTANGHADAKLS